MEKPDSQQNLLKFFFIVIASLLAASLYEILGALIFTGNCCSVHPVYNMPNVFILATLISTLYFMRKNERFSNNNDLTNGLKFLIFVLLVIIPFKKYIGVNDSSGLVQLYFIYSIFFAVGLTIIVKALKRLSVWKETNIFKSWFALLAAGAILFLIQSGLVFSFWGTAFECGILIFQIWLLHKFISLTNL